MSISTAQIRGARGILNWSQQDLSERTGISTTSIGAIEKGATQPRESNLQLIQKAFENAGIEFFENDGVRRRADEIRIFVGRNGYLDFFEDVYKTLEDNPNSEVFVNNVDERRFVKAHGDQADYHLARMSKLDNIRYKILLREGDNFFAVSQYAEYKWLPKNMFSTVPFYTYGQKLAIMLLDSEPKIIVINHPSVSEAYRMQFMSIWDNALTPDLETIKTFGSSVAS